MIPLAAFLAFWTAFSPQQEPLVFGVGVEVVRVEVLVTRNGQPVPGLTAADFEVRDNGVRQTLHPVVFEEAPVDALLVLDISGSVVGPKLEALRGAAGAFLDGLDTGDRAGLVGFQHTVTLALPLTGDLARVRVALETLAGASSDASVEGPADFGTRKIALWVSLSGVAVVLLMGVTNQLCLDIASVPFLWVLPLAVYLLTFIICFASERFYRRWSLGRVWSTLALAVACPLSEPAFNQGARRSSGLQSRPVAIARLCGPSLREPAWCSTASSTGAARTRTALTAYYLWVSAGGCAGWALRGCRGGALVRGLLRGALRLRGVVDPRARHLHARGRGPMLGSGTPPWRKGVAVVAGTRGCSSPCSPTSVIRRARASSTRSAASLACCGYWRPRKGRAPARVYCGTARRFTACSSRCVNLGRLPTVVLRCRKRGSVSRSPGSQRGVRCGSASWGWVWGPWPPTGSPGDLYRFYEIDPAVISLSRDSGLFSFLGESKALVEVVDGRWPSRARRGGPVAG